MWFLIFTGQIISARTYGNCTFCVFINHTVYKLPLQINCHLQKRVVEMKMLNQIFYLCNFPRNVVTFVFNICIVIKFYLLLLVMAFDLLLQSLALKENLSSKIKNFEITRITGINILWLHENLKDCEIKMRKKNSGFILYIQIYRNFKDL